MTSVNSVIRFSMITLPELAKIESDSCRTIMSAYDQEVTATLDSSMKVVGNGVDLIK